MKKLMAAIWVALVTVLVFAEDLSPSPEAVRFTFKIQGSITVGTDTLPTGPDGAPEPWTRLGIQPDISIGKFGFGLDLTLRFQMYAPPSWEDIRIYGEDWIPENGRTFLDVYLPKITYVRYGVRGEDPFHVKLGSIRNMTLGTGFILGDYSNMKLLPEQRFVGLDVGLDGSLLEFPWIGGELIMGNLARMDVVGTRLFVRPLARSTIRSLANMQIGGTLVVDSRPYLHGMAPFSYPESPVGVFGFDVIVPIIGGKVFPLEAFADIAFQPDGRAGEMLGLAGRVFKIFIYSAQLRFLQSGFIPNYFDSNYDLYRQERYDLIREGGTGLNTAGWRASIGVDIISDFLTFLITAEGPLSLAPSNPDPNPARYPHAIAAFRFGEGVFPVYLEASWEKYYIGRTNDFLPDLVEPEDSVVGLSVNYRNGPAVLTFQYDGRWDPKTLDFNNRTSILSTFKF